MYIQWKDLKNLTVSDEAIRFQISSGLGKDLEAAFTAAFTVYSNYTDAKVASQMDFVFSRARHMCTYSKKTLFPKMKEIILKHTGITIQAFHTGQDSKTPYPTGLFAVDMSFGDLLSALEVMAAYTGTTPYATASTTKTKQLLEDYRHIGDSLTPDGYLKERTYGKDKTPIAATMYFDPVTAFCLGDYIVKTHAEVRSLTAPEVTAIVLHELGHLTCQLEWSKDIYYTYQDKEQTFAYLKDHLQASDVEHIFSDTAALIKQEKSGVLSAEEKKTYIKTAELIDAAQQQKERYADTALWVQGLELIGSFIVSVFLSMYYVFITLGLSTYLGSIIDELVFNIRTPDTGTTKTSDTLATQKNLRLLEARADEFVARHGYSGDLATGLQNLIDAFNIYYQGGVCADPALQRNRLVIGMTRIVGVIYTLTGNKTASNYTYDDLGDRLRKTGENIIPALKQSRMLPASLVDRYLSDYEKVQKACMRATSPTERFVMTCARILKKVTVPSQLYRTIAEGGLRDEHGILDKNLDTLSNNSLYYYAAKFQQKGRR